MDTTVYYEMECGCILTREQLINGPRELNYRLVCPEHLKFIKYKYGYCHKCGNEIRYKNPQLAVALFCDICNPVLKLKRQYAAKKKKLKRINLSEDEIINRLIEASDCIYRPLCVAVHIKAVRLPCCFCNDYKRNDSLESLIYDINIDQMDEIIESIQESSSKNKADSLFQAGVDKWGLLFEKRFKDLK